MKKLVLISGLIATALFTGCSYKYNSTPAVMSYDGSKNDYSKADQWKSYTICKDLTEDGGDISVITAAKKAGISKIKHVDTSYQYKKFLFFTFAPKKCVTVYGE